MIDHSNLSKVFEKIMDSKYRPAEKSVLLVIFRETLHKDKESVQIKMSDMAEKSKIKTSKALHNAISTLCSSSALIVEKYSVGSGLRYNSFSLGDEFVRRTQ